jgi:hypothetical protein
VSSAIAESARVTIAASKAVTSELKTGWVRTSAVVTIIRLVVAKKSSIL